MEHVFRIPIPNGNPEIRDDLDGLGLSTTSGIKISVSVNKPFFFQQVQVLAYGGKPHLKILDDLHFAKSGAFCIYIGKPWSGLFFLN